MKLFSGALLILALVSCAWGGDSPKQAPAPAYHLAPAAYQKAVDHAHVVYRLHFFGAAYELLSLGAILLLGLAPAYRNRAESLSRHGFVRTTAFAAMLLLTVGILDFPEDWYSHRVALRFGLSVESWPSWCADWLKSQLLELAIGAFVVWILYAILRRSPRRWWFFFWLASLPLLAFGAFIEPLVIEPMFYHFEPLSARHPTLVDAISRLTAHAGLPIPANRMYEMRASEKTTELNAYVSGFGASKRLVIFDTVLAKETTDEMLSTVGHEMGHYVLGHIWKGLVFAAALILAGLYAGFRLARWVTRRWGVRLGIRGLDDLASLPVLLLLATGLAFLAEPVANAYSRMLEHEADVYGLEVNHGVVPDADRAAADSFQIEGTLDLADPAPSPFIRFWLFSHPPITDRIRFCLAYDPWSRGGKPHFVR